MCLEIEARAARKFSEFTTINDSFSYSEVLRNVKFSEATTSRKNLQVEDFPEALNLEFFSPGDSQPGVFEKTPGSNLKKNTVYNYARNSRRPRVSVAKSRFQLLLRPLNLKNFPSEAGTLGRQFSPKNPLRPLLSGTTPPPPGGYIRPLEQPLNHVFLQA